MWGSWLYKPRVIHKESHHRNLLSRPSFFPSRAEMALDTLYFYSNSSNTFVFCEVRVRVDSKQALELISRERRASGPGKGETGPLPLSRGGGSGRGDARGGLTSPGSRSDVARAPRASASSSSRVGITDRAAYEVFRPRVARATRLSAPSVQASPPLPAKLLKRDPGTIIRSHSS